VKRGFTIVELLVVVAIVLLLFAIATPVLVTAREVGRRAYCLANLRQIGTATHTYAAESRQELLIPIHNVMVSSLPPVDFWLHRTAMWFSVGGRSAPDLFLSETKSYMLKDYTIAGAKGAFAAETRPLNRYLFRHGVSPDGPEMSVFRCPSDRGYPLSPAIDDSPIENAERPCFNTLGSSYRASLYGIFPLQGQVYDGAFAIGPWGHRLSSITDASRVVAFGEPTFFNMVGLDNGLPNPDPVVAKGWHGAVMVDNVLFCDGGARPTRATGHRTVNLAEEDALLDIGPNWDLISRGPWWRFDMWPTPGARIWSADPNSTLWNPPYSGHKPRNRWWPFVGAQRNL
jgi:prepilin-type N-terminal cleavage/methylation domain-containing protein